MEARYIELGLGKRYGFVVGMERLSGVGRATLNGWFLKDSVPRLDALAAVAEVLDLTRAELVAAMDGQEVIELDRARTIVREEMARVAAGEPLQPQTSPPGRSVGTRSRTASGRVA
jgi:transcriptional regulator with XRE-family HTH domain